MSRGHYWYMKRDFPMIKAEITLNKDFMGVNIKPTIKHLDILLNGAYVYEYNMNVLYINKHIRSLCFKAVATSRNGIIRAIFAPDYPNPQVQELSLVGHKSCRLGIQMSSKLASDEMEPFPCLKRLDLCRACVTDVKTLCNVSILSDLVLHAEKKHAHTVLGYLASGVFVSLKRLVLYSFVHGYSHKSILLRPIGPVYTGLFSRLDLLIVTQNLTEVRDSPTASPFQLLRLIPRVCVVCFNDNIFQYLEQMNFDDPMSSHPNDTRLHSLYITFGPTKETYEDAEESDFHTESFVYKPDWVAVYMSKTYTHVRDLLDRFEFVFDESTRLDVHEYEWELEMDEDEESGDSSKSSDGDDEDVDVEEQE